jgi:hypothetical protein
MLTQEDRFKWANILRIFKTKRGNPAWERLVYDVVINHKFDFSKPIELEMEQDIETDSPELFHSVPSSYVKVVGKKQNPHDPLHVQREHLIEYSLKKYFNVKTINEVGMRQPRIAMISPASGTYLKLFYTQDIHICQAITNDPNDIERFERLVIALMRLAPNPKDVLEIGKRVCTCYQENEVCCHIKEQKPTIVMFPHSIYYVKDELINNILENGADIIYTAHIVKENSSGKACKYTYNNLYYLYKGQQHENKKYEYYRKKEKEKKYNPDAEREDVIASWENDNNQVEFDIKDDKLYKHRNFLPILYETSNVSTKTTVTTVDKAFLFENMKHVSGTIRGTPFKKNDFTSYTTKYKESSYMIQPGSRVDKINEKMKGNVYVHNDQKTDKTVIMRIFDTKTEFMTFRAGQFSIKEKMKWMVGNIFSEKEYMDLTRNYIVEKKANKIVINNEAFNGLMESLLHTEKIDSKILMSMWKRCLATFGSSATSWEQVYDILTVLLYEGLKTRIAINELENSDIVTALNNLLNKKEYSLATKIIDFLFKPTPVEQLNHCIKIEQKEEKDKKYQQTYTKYEDNPVRKNIEKNQKEIHLMYTNLFINIEERYGIGNLSSYKYKDKTRIQRMKTPTRYLEEKHRLRTTTPSTKMKYKRKMNLIKQRWRVVNIIDNFEED